MRAGKGIKSAMVARRTGLMMINKNSSTHHDGQMQSDKQVHENRDWCKPLRFMRVRICVRLASEGDGMSDLAASLAMGRFALGRCIPDLNSP